MKLLFVHDHKFRLIQDRFYSTGGLSDSALKRYTDVFGNTTVLARIVKENDAKSKYSEISNECITIKNGFDMNNQQLRKEVELADSIVIRIPSFLGRKIIKIAEELNKPYLVEVVGCPWDSLWNHSLRGKIIAPYITIEMKKNVKYASHALYVTNHFLQNRYPTNGKKVNCSNVSLIEFDSSVLDRRLKKIESNEEKIIIGTTAALDVKYKGQQYVIQALGNLKKEGLTNFEYQLVGGGSIDYLKACAEQFDVIDQVKFLGPKPHDEVFEWLETIDLYIQPSRQEGLPRALIEAMSRALPAIGANTGGIPELLEEKYIFSNKKSNIKEICDILKLLKKEDMKEQAKRNFEESKKYDRDVIEKRRTEFFEEYLKDKIIK